MGGAVPGLILVLLAAAFGIVLLIIVVVPLMKGVVWLFANLFKGIGWLFMHVFRFVGGMITDLLRGIGAVIAAMLYMPLVIGNIVIGRWSAAKHFGAGFRDEFRVLMRCVYRVVLSHPARFLLLSPVLEGIEQRMPEAVAHAPGSDRPSRSTGQFDGYTIVGSLPGGGSGAKLYVAEPNAQKLAALMRSGHRGVDQVVIKSFSLADGSSLPQIVRESRALEAAKKIGLVLEHELTDGRFFYVMPYVPGDSLGMVAKRLHGEAESKGLDRKSLQELIGYVADLLTTLETYHRAGLWHKDIKPDNIIVHDGRAHLVDLGLITPLRSAMTLTTHGTEYFRDPEMVRMALRGAKVHEVDGVKFDIYGTGAVLYSLVENSFPAHGGLSQISKRCPEALRWIVRRSMADLRKRYVSASEMLADLEVVLSASDPFALRPADLPSVRGGEVEEDKAPQDEFAEAFAPSPTEAVGMGAAVHRAGSPQPGAARREFKVEAAPAGVAAKPSRLRPVIEVSDWLTGRYVVRGERDAQGEVHPRPRRQGPFVFHASAGRAEAVADSPKAEASRVGHERRRPGEPRRSASEQLKSAQARVKRAQSRIHDQRRRHHRQRFSTEPSGGVFGAVAAFFVVIFVGIGIAAGIIAFSDRNGRIVAGASGPGQLFLQYDGAEGGVQRSSVAVASIEPDESTRVELFDEQGRSFVTYEIGQGRHAPAEVAAAFERSPRRVLLIYTLSDELLSEATEEFEVIRRTLADDNYQLIGAPGDTGFVDLLASARREIGLDPSTDPDARSRLEAWLETADAEGLYGVIWYGDDVEGLDRRIIAPTPEASRAIVEAIGSRRSW